MDSVRANERKLKTLDMFANMKEEDLMPESAYVAGIYCSIGKATCSDLDTEQLVSAHNVQYLKKMILNQAITVN